MYKGKFNNAEAPKKYLVFGRFTIGTVIFYSLFFVFILAFIIGLSVGINTLTEWLGDFEAAQSTAKSQEVFQELFQDPDWAALYEMSGQEDTVYEGKEAYVAYMEALTDGKELTMAKTSAGLDTTKEKYLVKLDKQIIADFMLVNKASADSPVPEWTLDQVSVYFERRESVKILTAPDCTVFINGVALDDSHIISTTTTVAEKYLSEGLHGYRDQILTVGGLLVPPTVTVQDATGAPADVVYNAQTGMYTQIIAEHVMTEEIKNTAVAAAKAFADYMMAKKSQSQMQQYFDKNGNAYQTLPPTWDLWVQSNKGYVFSEPVVTDYYAYSEILYSIRVSFTVSVTRTDDTIKDYELDSTFFFKKMPNGSWLVTDKTNEYLQERITMVKLSFYTGQTLLHNEFANSTSTSLILPIPEAPAGQKFVGWYLKTMDANGNTTMRLIFNPDETGTVHLPGGTVLESMELYAQFEKVDA